MNQKPEVKIYERPEITKSSDSIVVGEGHSDLWTGAIILGISVVAYVAA